MAPFPWDLLKVETLRSICRDLGANLGTKRKREDLITFLKEVATRGWSSTSQDCESTGKIVPTTQVALVSDNKAPVTKLPSPSHDPCEDSDSGDDMDSDGNCPNPDSESTCPCTDGLSPRMKFILSTVAAVASDLVRDTGELAGELGHVGGVYMTQHIPQEALPLGKKAAALWVDGLSTIYGVIHKMFEAGRIPTETALLEALEELPQSERILVVAYANHTEIGDALSGLVQQAAQEWVDEFQEIHCDCKKWRKLPVCTEHDLDWTLAEDVLIG